MTDLASRDCVPCKGGVPPLGEAETRPLLEQLDEGWEIVEDHHLGRTYRFENFRTALDYVNAVGEMAENVGHHPDLALAWGRVGVEIWTHKIDGLHEADFIFAAKCDRIYRER
jgi:4a-hydroxytetrahydrobiopterin dehydratase